MKLLTTLLLIISLGANPQNTIKANNINKEIKTDISKEVTIKVVDDETKEELIGVTVKIDGEVHYTDLNGEVNVKLNRNKKYKIVLEGKTYETKTYINLKPENYVFKLDSNK